jgi:acyl carrier protein
MPDKTTLGISAELCQYIEALVEEVVLEDKPFENHKKYLCRFCEAEGIDFASLETNLTDLFESFEAQKTHESKRNERMARILGKECFLSEDKLEQLITYINKQRYEREARAAAEQRARKEAERETKKKIEQQVKSIISDTLGVEESDITNSTDILWDLGPDSLDLVELIMAFERVYGVNITDDMLNSITTVGDIITLLVQKTRK